MADLDNLQIQIKASSSDAVSAVDKLIGALGRLNTSLNNYKSGSQYAQGMESLASGLERVAKAVNSIDDGKMKRLSSAMSSLNKAGGNLSIGQSVNKEMSIAERRIDAFTKKLASAFDIKDKKSIEVLRDDISQIVKEPNNLAKNMSTLHKDVGDFAMIENAFAGANREVKILRQSLKSLKWDKADSAEYGDDLIRTLGKLGYRGKGNVDASTLAQELHDAHGFNFDTSSNVSAINDMIKYLEMATTEQVSLNEAIARGEIQAKEFFSAFSEATRGLEAEPFANNSKRLSNAELGISEVQQVSQVNTNALQQVAQGLQAIQSVGQLPDFSGISVLARNINKLGAENASTLATTLPEIASGLKAFSGLDIPNFPNLEGFAKGLKELRGMGAKSASEASAILPRIAESLRDFQGLSVPNLEGIESFSKALRSLGSGNIVNASTSLKPIADGLRELSDIQINTNVEQLTAFAKAINSLGKENTATAIENLPRLAQAFNELVNAINQGNISERTASFAQSLAQLTKNSGSATAGMQRVGVQAKNWYNLFEMLGAKVRQFVNGGLRLLGSYLKNVGGLFVKSAQQTRLFVSSLFSVKQQSENVAQTINRLAHNIGKFWSSMFWVVNGIRGLWKSVESSMNYIETLNYFKASFKQVSKTAVGNWAKLGYDSAEAYADSFEQRAKQLTSKMTGFSIEDTGVLKMTGGKTLGLNPNTLLNYQAQFAQMASSMGASANNATLLSQALVEIGADLASVKNMKFEDVWQDMASGMVGMSRTLDKYGVNIRKASLNQKLLELGLDTTVDKLSGADKAMLRTIVLLDSTKYAWGDLSRTLNQPANQLRLLTANLQNCARMIGNLFLPMVAKVLPYLNAMTIAVQRLLTFLAKILGIDISKITSGVGGSNEAISDLLDDADNLDGALDDASESAKKLKNNLLGVDELNIVSDNITSTDANGNMSSLLDDAFLDALSEYQKAWDEAFDAMENRANELADKIVQFFKDLFRPISEAWKNVGQDVKDAWAKAFNSLGELLKSVFKDVWDVWQSDLTTDIFENIFNTVKDIGLIISNLADNFRKAWEEGGRGKAILEAIWKIVWAISENVKEVADYFVEWSANLNFAPILESTKNFLEAIARNAKDIIGIFADWYKIVWGGIGKYLIEDFFPSVLDSLTKMVDLIDWGKLRADIDGIYESLVELAKLVGGVLLTAFDKLATTIGKGINPFVERLSGSFKNLVDDLKNAKDVNDVIDAIFDFGDDRAVDLGKLVHFISENINKALDSIDFKNVGRRLAGMINKLLDEVDVNELAHTIAGLVNGLFDVALGFIGKLDWFKIGQAIGDALRQIDWLKIIKGIFELIWGLLKGWLGSLGSAPLETLLLSALGIGSLGNSISKALFGEGLLTHIIKSVTGINKEKKGFGKLADSAEDATTAKLLFNKANKKLGKGAEDSADDIAGELTMLQKLKIAVPTIIKEITGIAGVAGGSFLAITNFTKQLAGGFDWAQEGLMLLGIAIAGVGATLMGAPAVVAGIVASIVGVVATAVVVIKQHWQDITEWFKGIGDNLAGAWETLKQKFSDLKQYIKDHWGEIVEALKFGARDAREGVAQIWDTMKQDVANFVQTTKEKFIEWKDNAVQAFREWKDSAVEAFQVAWDKFIEWKDGVIKGFVEWKTKVIEQVLEWKDRVVEAVGDWYETTKEKFASWIEDAKQKFQDWKDNVVQTAEDWKNNVIKRVSDFATNTVNTLKKWYEDASNAIKNWFGEVVEKFQNWKEAVINIVDAWKNTVVNIFNSWKDAVVSIFEAWRKAVGDVLDGLKEFIGGIADWCREAVDKFREFKDNAVREFREFRDNVRGYIENFVSHFKQHIGDFISRAREAFSDFKQRAVDAFSTFFTEGIRNIVGFIEQTKGKFTEWKNNIITTISNLKEGAIDLFKKLWEGAKSWFSKEKWTFDGIREGIKEAITNAWSYAQSLIDSFHDWLATLPAIFEDLRAKVAQFASEVGQKIAQGASSAWNGVKEAGKTIGNAIGNGIKQGFETAEETTKRIAENAKKTLQEAGRSFGNYTQNLVTGRQYKTYATGGFPEDGWFRASHGEMIGHFDNGQSVVANNQQITEGISRAVYDAMVSAGMNRGREEELLEELIDAVRSGRNITIDGRELVSAYDNRKARNGYAFT